MLRDFGLEHHMQHSKRWHNCKLTE